MLTCFDVADYFVHLANETGSFLSNLKLQKLVYYAQAWHLALKGTPLFDEDFQAWIHGPVVPTLYQKYKPFSWTPIIEDAQPNLPADTQEFLGEVAAEYFARDAYELEQMTHIEALWVRARGGIADDMPSTAVIPKEWIKEYFSSRVETQDQKHLSSAA